MNFLKDAHAKKIEWIINFLQTDKSIGIASVEALNRQSRFGLNAIEKVKKSNFFAQIFEQFKDPILVVLLGAFTVTMVIGKYESSLAIFFVVFFNSALGIFQQWKASKSIKALSSFISQHATVIRDGIKLSIPTENLVLGDLLYLEAGNKVPADARLIETVNFFVDQSILSGESIAVEKDADEIYPQDCFTTHQNNMVFSGTTVSKGRGLAIVTAIGMDTELGDMSRSIQLMDETPSPLQIRIKDLSNWITLFIILFIILIFLLGLLRGFDPFSLFITSVSLIVTAIPEGLPLAVTLCLFSGIHKMAKHKAVVRKLSAVETLGSCNVICSDKTGTITTHQMMVNSVYVGKTLFPVTGVGYEPIGGVQGKVVLDKIAQIAAFTHECRITQENGKYNCIGDPTDGALVTLANKIGYSNPVDEISFDIPFESERRWMAVTISNRSSYCVFIKGALEEILKKSAQMLDENGKAVALDRQGLLDQEKAMALKGERVIALAYFDTNHKLIAEEIDELKQFIIAGIVSIQDPPRKAVRQAIENCKRANIKVKMITGDNPLTAKSIGEIIKISDKPLQILTGEELEKISLEKRIETIKRTDIFARVLPKHKMMIVSALQESGDVVAMTGDGVNDALSLKKADMGVALGSGADVAKDAASLVILDDDFSTIVEAVKYGRIIFENLQKMINYLITTAISGVSVIMTTTLLGWPIPLLPMQLLWINLVTDGTSTIPLALDGGSDEVLNKNPLPKTAPIIDKNSLIRMVILGLYMSKGSVLMFFYSYYYLNEPLIKAQTMAFTTLALFQIWNVHCFRSMDQPILLNFKKLGLPRLGFTGNNLLFGLTGLAFFLQILVTEIPFFQKIIVTQSINFNEWLMIFFGTFSIVIVSDLAKYLSFKLFKLSKK